MADVKPFLCIRPNKRVVSRVAALPYDVYNREEAKKEVEREPQSFLAIDRAETQLDDSVDAYDERVYQKARETLEDWIDDGTYIGDEGEAYYIYRLTMEGRSQTGIVACASIDDYLDETIRKHENTRADKERDRIRHVDACNAQTGPIFLAYRSTEELAKWMEVAKKAAPLYDFTTGDGVGHTVWQVNDGRAVEGVRAAFASMDHIYIADGHHRAASAVKVGLARRKENPGFTGKEEFNYFLSVLFPHDQLRILDYNRVVRDVNGWSDEEFFEKIREYFLVEAVDGAYRPQEKATFGMYYKKKWYRLEACGKLKAMDGVVESLDVSLLQDYLLGPVLGIGDPRTDDRIDFVGGVRGLGELERRVDGDMEVAFSLYPTSITELFSVADAGKLMPPKSTWFEPKLRSGIFIHRLS